MEISFETLPEEAQLELYKTLHKKFGRTRDSSYITREKKLKIVANLILCLDGFNIAQQRTVLVFTLELLTNAQHRWWRDEKEKVNKKVKEKGGK